MSNFVFGNYDLRTALIFCYIWRKLLQNHIEYLSKVTGILLVNHSALSGSKNSKVAILIWETKNVENHRKSLKTANCKHCWMRMTLKLNNTRGSIECDTRSRLHTFEIYGKDPEDGKMGSTTEWKTVGKQKNYLRNAARQVQKKVISPSNCDWRWKVDIFWES